MVDYTALAKANGAISSTPPNTPSDLTQTARAIDYTALAKANGAVSSVMPPVAPTPPQPLVSIPKPQGNAILGGIGMLASRIAKVPSDIINTFQKGGQNVTQDISNIQKNAQDAGGGVIPTVLSGAQALGHVAGDVAGTTGALIGDVISPVIPDSIKKGIGDISSYLTDKISTIPGMTPEIQKGLGDVFNTLTLKGGAKAEPTVTSTVAPIIKNAPEAVSTATQALKEQGAGIVAPITENPIVRATVNKILPQTPEVIAKNEQMIAQARQNVANVYEKSLPLTPTQLIKENTLKAKTGDNLFTTLANHDINIGNPEAMNQIHQVSDQFSNALNYAQANETAHFNVDQIEANAFSNIDSKLSSETARQTAKNKITDEINALLKANKDKVITDVNGNRQIPSDLVERLRRTGNSWTPFNASDPEKIGNSAGYSLSNAVRDQVDKQGTFPSYRQANQEWGKVIHAQEMMQNIYDSGKKFKVAGGLAGSITRKVLSGILGFHTGGLGGAVLAEMGSETAARVMSDPALKTYFNRKIIENMGQKTTPEVILRLKNEVDNFIAQRENIPRLPAPSYIPMGAKTVAETPAQIIPATKNPVTVNPKTGKFQTSYSSNTNVTIPPTKTPIIKAKINIKK